MEGSDIVALNRYRLQSPQGNPTKLDVAEFLKFDESDKLIASNIYFDTHRFQEFIQANKSQVSFDKCFNLFLYC